MNANEAQSGNADHFALRVALQTMKERYITLQKRFAAREDDYQRELKSEASTQHSGAGGASELLSLRLRCAEIERQKMQLTDDLNMVSNENRKLWSRLSRIAKDGKDSALTNEDNEDVTLSPRSGIVANQNLIRSKTFTQHSPNPNLRLKLIPNNASVGGETSLDGVQFDNYETSSRDMGAGEDYAEAAEADFNFAYLHVSDETACAKNVDLNMENTKCIEGMDKIIHDAMLQQQQLLLALKNVTDTHPCPGCVQKSQKPEMADKSLETDESLNEAKTHNINQITPQDVSLSGNNFMQAPIEHAPSSQPKSQNTPQLNIIEEKIQADNADKMCPMCGKMYPNSVSFDAFREHVEMHFHDDGEGEASLERNYEYVSHAVGDF